MAKDLKEYVGVKVGNYRKFSRNLKGVVKVKAINTGLEDLGLRENDLIWLLKTIGEEPLIVFTNGWHLPHSQVIEDSIDLGDNIELIEAIYD